MQRDRGDALLHVAVEFRAHRIGGVAGINERRIGDDAAEQILHGLVAPHGFGERRPAGALRRETRELAFVILLEGDAFALAAVEIAPDVG